MKYMMAKVLYGAVGILLAAACICQEKKVIPDGPADL